MPWLETRPFPPLDHAADRPHRPSPFPVRPSRSRTFNSSSWASTDGTNAFALPPSTRLQPAVLLQFDFTFFKTKKQLQGT